MGRTPHEVPRLSGEGAPENNRWRSKVLFLPHLALSYSGITLCHFSRAHHTVSRKRRFPDGWQIAANWRALPLGFESLQRPNDTEQAFSAELSLGSEFRFPVMEHVVGRDWFDYRAY